MMRDGVYIAFRGYRLSALVAAMAVTVGLALAACGSAGTSTTSATSSHNVASSKPAYCSALADLAKSLNKETDLSDQQALEAQVKKIESSATKVVSQAKSSFPKLAQHIKASVDSLARKAKELRSNSSIDSQLSVAREVLKVQIPVQFFFETTKSNCK